MVNMKEHYQKMRDFYAHKPGARIYQREFGFFTLDRWKAEGYIQDDTDLAALFGFDPEAKVYLGGLGWCEPEFCPWFEEKLLEDRGEYELVQDFAGRGVLYFKGRRNGFMPEYVTSPVTDWDSWERNCKWRMDPNTPERYKDLEARMEEAAKLASEGALICQNLVGGYMYLRSLMGPEQLLYMFYDDPGLIHECMKTWFTLADTVTARRQQYITFDELFFGEDICYNNGPLISPDMMREFLFPYYQQLIANVKKRQKDKDRKLHIQIDTDGRCTDVIEIYQSIGMDALSPLEVASGCDVVAIREKYPDLLLSGGFDKRILAESKEAIDREVDRIMPAMVKSGGYLPTCDHGVPEEVPFENYMHYRKRMLEF